MLGTLIFEGGAEPDCLRLLVGRLPAAQTGPASTSTSTSHISLPLSPYYPRLLSDLAKQRGFDGYLLNFECPLQGGIEQTRALAAWIKMLRDELREKVGPWTEVVWYDSVIFTGQLRWQDRLNSLNLPFFLESSSIFTNYTWPPTYPILTAQYLLSLDSALLSEHGKNQKSLQDIYMGVDIWNRGSHGSGSFGSYRALQHISPSSLGLSVAVFGQAWTWESEQDKDDWTWEGWWDFERLLWAGATSRLSEDSATSSTDKEKQERIPIPEMKEPCECTDTPYEPLSSFFPRYTPPNLDKVAFHTTFNPGVGRAWWVCGEKVFDTQTSATFKFLGWTDVHKQTSMGNLLWPTPKLALVDERSYGSKHSVELSASGQVVMDDAWNGGSCVKVSMIIAHDWEEPKWIGKGKYRDDDDGDDSDGDNEDEDYDEDVTITLDYLLVPIQSLSVSLSTLEAKSGAGAARREDDKWYEAVLVYKVESEDLKGEGDDDGKNWMLKVKKEFALAIQPLEGDKDKYLGKEPSFRIERLSSPTNKQDLGRGWTRHHVQFCVRASKPDGNPAKEAAAKTEIEEIEETQISLDLFISLVSYGPPKVIKVPVLLGQVDVYPIPTPPSTNPPSAPASTSASPTPASAPGTTPETKPDLKILWADFKRSSKSTSSSTSGLTGLLTWSTALSLPLSTTRAEQITSAEDPVPVWEPFSSSLFSLTGSVWTTELMYANIYVETPDSNGVFRGPVPVLGVEGGGGTLIWIGTSSCGARYDARGRKDEFEINEGVLEGVLNSSGANGRPKKVQFYIQGITDRGEVLDWERCVWVEVDM
ncbi:hypothetical protein VKT23_009563 [Stygiomarasmius scandens]